MNKYDLIKVDKNIFNQTPYKILSVMELSRGMFRVFILLALIAFSSTLYIQWNDIDHAWHKVQEAKYNGLVVRNTPPSSKPFDPYATVDWLARGGWAHYSCLCKVIGSRYINDDHVMHVRLENKVLHDIVNSMSFRGCVEQYVAENQRDAVKTTIIAFSISFTSIFICYFLLLISIHLFKWIRDGFKN